MTAFQSRGWLLSGVLILLSAFFPLADAAAPGFAPQAVLYAAALVFLLVGGRRRPGGASFAAALVLLVASAAALTAIVHRPDVAGGASWGFWLKAVGLWLASWMAVDGIADGEKAGASRWHDLAPAVLFGATLLALWEWIVAGFGIQPINLLAPSAIGAAVGYYAQTLVQDFVWTFLREVLLGWLVGSGAGFAVALVADRIPFLRRGLLPLGNIVSALPIVGIAPVMIWWFSYEWPSKTAVVIAMTFFPMLVNTVAGLAATGSLERDLMRSYGATYWPTLVRLRLPAAMPFIFNGLKINSTLAMIGAIVAEYFDGPTMGMGFRINTRAALSDSGIVWAEIAVAMVAGSLFYGIIALVERAVTFWHPSYRRA
ncbi:ABC transporter permease [Labrys monachus]|uniref:NitT/TauT family transport system permease protein n=1 Tax=Labrys monachus TaxID=217067 RepID=A0ABU0FIQ3_9HYPH|nr:ABC transporter permease [Labrys monachus]MDQ0394497.1 NitT/TauT family transport system permease protein [Labrys monachus]